MRAEFQIGEQEVHTIEVFCSWTGLEVVKIDGAEIWRTRAFPSLNLSSSINFSVGVQEIHNVTIKLSPFTPMAQVFVDDNLAIKHLFPQLARIEEVNCPLCYVVFMIVGIGLIGLLELIQNLRPTWPINSPVMTFLVVVVSFELTRALVRSRSVKWLRCGEKNKRKASSNTG